MQLFCFKMSFKVTLSVPITVALLQKVAVKTKRAAIETRQPGSVEPKLKANVTSGSVKKSNVSLT